MNAREQLMKKRIESLEGQVKVALDLLDRVLADLELTESIGAAFAWDLVTTEEDARFDEAPVLAAIEVTERRWDEAVKALEESQKP